MSNLGVVYVVFSEVFSSPMEKPAYASPFVDQWGTFVTGCAPIVRGGNKRNILFGYKFLNEIYLRIRKIVFKGWRHIYSVHLQLS